MYLYLFFFTEGVCSRLKSCAIGPIGFPTLTVADKVVSLARSRLSIRSPRQPSFMSIMRQNFKQAEVLFGLKNWV
jgi:hypothetical protein